jgi:glycosyltransferase involved in cell wall biosynthesis
MSGDPGRPARILHTLPDLATGGGQILLLRNLIHMKNSGFSPVVCALRGGSMAADFRAHDIPTVVLGGSLPVALVRLVRLARRERIDLIHTNNTPPDRLLGQVTGMVLRLPVVNSFHALAPIALPWPSRVREVGRFIRQRLVRQVNRGLISLNLPALIAVSEAVRRSQAQWLGLPPERFTVIHNGLPPEAWQPAADEAAIDELRRTMGLEGRYPVVLNVGRLVEGKGQRLLVPMMARLIPRWPDACLLLAGEGEDRPVLDELIAAHGLERNVRLLGNRGDVPTLLALSDLFISASYYEGFGLALLEAMAAGRPVVALHTPAFEEFLDDGVSGLFVHRADPESLAEAVARIAADPALADALGRAGRQRSEAFSVAATADKLSRLYAALTQESYRPSDRALPIRYRRPG